MTALTKKELIDGVAAGLKKMSELNYVPLAETASRAMDKVMPGSQHFEFYVAGGNDTIDLIKGIIDILYEAAELKAQLKRERSIRPSNN